MSENFVVVLNSYYTLIAATVVLLVGRVLVKRIAVLAKFNIPEPVVGGLIAALLVLIFHQINGFSIQIEKGLQDGFMLMFFASIGLSADFKRLKSGGLPLVLFTSIVAGFIVVQNIVGISLASLLGLPPLTGLITGSMTLVGGHGTAAGWGQIFESDFGIQGAVVLGMACATFGLVCGGLIGGPVARRLMKKVTIPEHAQNTTESVEVGPKIVFEQPQQQRIITADSAVETLALFAICLASASFLSNFMAEHFGDSNFVIPTFVWALASGVVVRNVLTKFFKVTIFDRSVDVFGNVSLSLFLAMALLSLELWMIKDLAIPLIVILSVQAVLLVLFAVFVVFRVMGKDYDAAVLAGGFCGFGMGATPTAVANMQAVTDRFGPSHKAFLIVPMVGAFFVDIINATVLSAITSLPFLN
ncbi:sodium/glutamate symporter [Denitrificimonas sp. JX-1]|uniref:Sodium/glutamate symporter n=1 Tax=Denitrificimonas halotolerans TaxID=3098930 RepID=A0ABU5GTN5_9GAMM|nr:sodium/glutamate symporter [Denitrificimonas sp. JX-1]MDY7219857.1 sodium/glutamate symporter [Denitrificimonas sp. JX-1]